MIYEYKCKHCGNEFEVVCNWRDKQKQLKCDECGNMADEVNRAPNVVGCNGKCWPMVSEAAGISPEGVPDMKKRMLEQGVHCDFDNEGRPIFTSGTHRKKCLKVMGLVDKSAYC